MTCHHIKTSTHVHQHHCFLKPTFRRGFSQHFSSRMRTSHCLRRYICILVRVAGNAVSMEAFPNRNPFSVLLKSLEISIAVALENYAVSYGPPDIIAWPFYRGVVKFLWQSQRAQLKVKQAELGCLRAFFGPSTLFLNCHAYVGATIVPWNLSWWPATPSKPVSVVHRFSFCYSALLRKKCTNRRHI